MARVPRKKNPWVVSSFDSFRPEHVDSNKRQRPTAASSSAEYHDIANSKKCKSTAEMLWVENHHPKTQEELAVHKKKITEVKSWLEECLSSRKCSRMLLLTGPTGAGKTATLIYLAKEMNFEIQEWTNKPGLSLLYDQALYNESQICTFRSFLFRASRYSSNQIFGADRVNKKVILMEEFPTAFIRDVSEFHGLLRQYRHFGSCPLVFIVTDSVKEDKNERSLFPKDLQKELNIMNISFNPVAASKLFASISRIANIQGLSLSKQDTDMLVENSHGDIRAAINALQFTFHQDSCPVPKPKSAKRVRWTTKKLEKASLEGSTNLFGARDESLFLFHALGKILHCKRDWDNPISHQLRPEMIELERHKLLINPEEIGSKISVSSNNFAAFLHQNYLPFFSDVESVTLTSNYFSEADCFNNEWLGDSPLPPYIFSVATRGVLYGMKTKIQTGWKPLHKPSLFSVIKKYKERTDSGREIFQERYFHLAKEELFSQLIPYLIKTGQSSLTKEQQLFIDSVGNIALKNTGRPRDHTELLDEKDIVEDSCPPGGTELSALHSSRNIFQVPHSQIHLENQSVPIIVPIKEEEIVIEEYDY